MTLAIHEQGGLTEAEIRLAIEESAERREAVLDAKLASHRADIKAELDKTTQLVNTNNDRLIGMQGQISSIAAETKAQTERLQSVIAKGEEWHSADLVFRADVLARVGKIEAAEADLTDAVTRLRWIGVLSFHLGRASRFAWEKCRDADAWKLIAGVLLLYLLKLSRPALAALIAKAIK